MKNEVKKSFNSESVNASEPCRVQVHVLKPNFESEVPRLDGKSEMESINAAFGPLIVDTYGAARAAKNDDLGAGYWIHAKVDKYEETGNAVYLVEAFLLSHELGVFPPAAVLNWLAKSFDEFHKKNGIDDKGKALNVSRMLGLAPGKGQEKLFQPLLREELDDQLMLDMAKLVIQFELSAVDAARVIEAKLCATAGWNRSKFDIKAPYAAELVKKYSKARGVYEAVFSEPSVPKWTDEQRRDFIICFPKGCFSQITPKGKKRLENYLK
jgi:hypothetical protein